MVGWFLPALPSHEFNLGANGLNCALKPMSNFCTDSEIRSFFFTIPSPSAQIRNASGFDF